MKPVHEWPEIWRSGLVTSVETSVAQDGTRVEKLRLSDRIRRIELIGKHTDVRAFVERSKVTGKDGGPIEATMVFNPVTTIERLVRGFYGGRADSAKCEWTDDTDVLMAEPYIRIGTMFAVFMAPFIVLKIVLETIMHLREHTPPATTR